MAHQGQAMLDIIARTPFRVEDVADMIGVNRRTIYLWGKKETLEGYIIDRVSNAIGVDMRATMPAVFGPGQTIFPKKAHKNNVINSSIVEYWKEKYDSALSSFRDSEEKLKNANVEIKQLKAALYDVEKENKRLQSK